MYSALNILSEYTYFYLSKNITSFNFLFNFQIIESLQCTLKLVLISPVITVWKDSTKFDENNCFPLCLPSRPSYLYLRKDAFYKVIIVGSHTNTFCPENIFWNIHRCSLFNLVRRCPMSILQRLCRIYFIIENISLFYVRSL